VETGATILDGAVVGKNSIIGAGSLVGAGKVIPSGEFWSGIPAKFVRKLSQEEIASLSQIAEHHHSLAAKHDAELSKSPAEVQQDQLLSEYGIPIQDESKKYQF